MIPVFNTNKYAGWIIKAQILVTLAVAGACLSIGMVSAYSALLGGLVCIGPGLYAAIRMEMLAKGSDTKGKQTWSGSLVLIEAGKFGLSVTLFIAVFIFVKPLNAFSFFGTFIALQFCYVLVPLMESRRLRKWHEQKR